MSNLKEYIYALYFDDFSSPQHLLDGPDEVMFYIGRTTNPDRRLKQHRYEAKKGAEDKYVFIRELISKNIDWDLKVLKEVDNSDNMPWEYWYVIESIRNGAPLKNMKYGDFQHISTNRLKSIATDAKIRTIDDLKKVIDEENVKTSTNYSSSKSVQLRAIIKSLRWLRTESEERNGTVSKWNIYDLGEGTEEVKAEFYMTKKEVAQCLTPEFIESIRKVERMIAKQNILADTKKLYD